MAKVFKPATLTGCTLSLIFFPLLLFSLSPLHLTSCLQHSNDSFISLTTFAISRTGLLSSPVCCVLSPAQLKPDTNKSPLVYPLWRSTVDPTACVHVLLYCICVETCPGLTYGTCLPTPSSLTPSLFQLQPDCDVFWAIEGR